MIAALFLTIATAFGGGVVSDYIRLVPAGVPTVCNTGDLRVDSSDSNKLKVCKSNTWIAFLDTTSGITTFSGIMTGGTISAPVITLSTIATSQISGTLSQSVLGTYLGNLAASQLTGTINQSVLGTYLGNIAGSQIASGTIDTARIGTYLGDIAATQVTSGTMNQAQLGFLTGGTLNASLVGFMTSGTLNQAAVGFLSSGTISQSVLGSYAGTIATSQVTAGTFALARIGTIPGANIASDLAASQIGSGTLAMARIGVVTLSAGGTGSTTAAAARAALGINDAVYFSAHTATTTGGTGTPIIFSTELSDTDSAYDNSTGRFTVPTSKGGFYCFFCETYKNSAAYTIFVYQNAAQKNQGSSLGTASNASGATWCAPLSAGDIIDCRSDNSGTASSGGQGLNVFYGWRVFGGP